MVEIEQKGEKLERAGGANLGSETGAGAADFRGTADTPENLSARINQAMTKESPDLRQVSADMKATLSSAFEQGGNAGMKDMIQKIDSGIGKPGDGNGLKVTNMPDGSTRIQVVRTISDENVQKVLNMAQPGKDNPNITQTRTSDGPKWAKVLGTVDLDPKSLDNKVENKTQFEKNQGRPMEEIAREVTAALKQGIRDYGGQGVPESIMKTLTELTGRSAESFQAALNKELKGSGISVELNHTEGHNDLHGKTVRQEIAEVKYGNNTIARKTQRYDTVRSLSVKDDDFGIIRGK